MSLTKPVADIVLMSLFAVTALTLASRSFNEAKQADSPGVVNAVSAALKAETQNGNVSALPLNKSFTTIIESGGARPFDNDAQTVVFEKVGDTKNKPDCGQFDVVVLSVEPVGHSTSQAFGKNVQVCTPR